MTVNKHSDKRSTGANSVLAKVAVQCSADPEVSGWLIKHWCYASIPIAIGMVKIATFAKPQNVGVMLNDTFTSLNRKRYETKF